MTKSRPKKPSQLYVGLRIGTSVLTSEISPYSVVRLPDGSVRKKQAVWTCLCDCGREKVISAASLYAPLKCGRIPCECNKPLVGPRTTHGMSKTSEHKAWLKIKERCRDLNCKDYPDYGGRGIAICARWLESFENFYADMGAKPTPTHSIDRLDVNGDYEPGNCRWATPIEQANNKRTNVRVVLGETEMSVSDAARITGINPKCLVKRAKKGFTGAELFEPRSLKTMPPDERKALKGRPYTWPQTHP